MTVRLSGVDRRILNSKIRLIPMTTANSGKFIVITAIVLKCFLVPELNKA